MKGFLAFHRLPKTRRSFVDELYVAPAHRKQRVALSLMSALSKGPIELHVSKTNTAAMALYLSLGMCSMTDRKDQAYGVLGGEINLRTKSYRRTRALLQERDLQEPTVYTWDDLPDKTRSAMVQGLAKHKKISSQGATDLLRGDKPEEMRYAVL